MNLLWKSNRSHRKEESDQWPLAAGVHGVRPAIASLHWKNAQKRRNSAHLNSADRRWGAGSVREGLQHRGRVAALDRWYPAAECPSTLRGQFLLPRRVHQHTLTDRRMHFKTAQSKIQIREFGPVRMNGAKRRLTKNRYVEDLVRGTARRPGRYLSQAARATRSPAWSCAGNVLKLSRRLWQTFAQSRVFALILSVGNSPDHRVTQFLLDWTAGDKAALEQLTPLVYDELRRVAQRHLRRERHDHTLQRTALVHEAFLRLVNQDQVQWKGRAHFLGLASHLMRRILVDHARARLAAKRGDGVRPASFDDTEGGVDLEELSAEDHADAPDGPASAESRIDLQAVDEALTRLERIDPEQAKLVELRFFGGLTIEETALSARHLRCDRKA